MLQFEDLHLKNCVYFKDAKFPLNTKDILIVNGKNLKSREKEQTNGSGKSLFYSYIPNIVFASHPLANRSNSKKEMYASNISDNEGSSATLTFSSNDTKYKVRQKINGATVGYSIYENGKNLGVRTTPLSEKYIKSIFPLTEAEFYTTVYLNSQRDFVFQRGKSEARLKFFTEFFRLDYYDQMKSYFQDELKKIKRVEIEVSTLEGQRLRLVEDLKELEESLQDTQDLDIESAKEKQKLYQAKRKKYSKELDQLTRNKGYAELYNQLTEAIGGKAKPSAKNTDIQNKKLRLALSYQETKKEYKKQLAFVKELQDLVAGSKEEIQTKCKEYGVSLEDLKNFDLDDLIIKEYKKCKDDLQNAEESYQEYTEAKKQFKAVYKQKTSQTKEEIESRIAEYQSTIRTFKKLKEHLEDDKCPICGSIINLENLTEKAEAAKAQIAEQNKFLEFVEAKEHYYECKSNFDEDQLTTLQQKFEKLEQKYKNYQKLKTANSKILDLINEHKYDVRKQKDNAGQLLAIKENLEALDEGKKYVPEIEDLQESLATNNTLVRLYAKLETLISECNSEDVDVKSLDLNAIKEDQKTLQNRLFSLEGKIESLGSFVQRHEIHQEKEKLLNKKLSEVSTKIEELNTILADKELLENLIKVYSNKGIKIQRVNAICRLLERNLNHFKSLIFDENFKFSINITESSFDVIVDRNDGIISDVRLLSGSEGRRFNLLLLISLLPLTPANRRSNVVILDEMESNASPTSIRLFCDRFIPELHKLVPTVIVVTPLNLDIENSKRVLVTKDDSGSKIEFVNEMRG